MSYAYSAKTVMINAIMNTGFTGRDVATSCTWLDPQVQQPAFAALKRDDERGAGTRSERHARRKTPMRLPTPSRLPSLVCLPTLSRGG